MARQALRVALLAGTAVGLAGVLTAGGCGLFGGDSGAPEVDVPKSITVTSEAFDEDGRIPREHTCDGAETPPPLAWSGVPDDAAALALVIDDPDAPRGTYVHWVVFNLDPGSGRLAQPTPPAARQAENSAGEASYAGPCPPSGTHRYRFTVYALDRRLDLDSGASLDAALGAIEDAAIATGRLTGRYSA